MNTGSTTAPLETLPVLDHSILQQLVNDTSEQAATAILGAFLTEIEKLQADTSAAAPQGQISDFDVISSSAHRCKSSAAYCGAVRLQQLTLELEQAARDKDQTQALHLLEHLSEICDLTRAAIEERNQA